MTASRPHRKTESEVDLLDGPPPLPYSLYPRKKAIAITWSIICFDSCLLPIIMFYSLWFTNLSHTTGTNHALYNGKVSDDHFLLSVEYSIIDIRIAFFYPIWQTCILLMQKRLYVSSSR